MGNEHAGCRESLDLSLSVPSSDVILDSCHHAPSTEEVQLEGEIILISYDIVCLTPF